VPIERLCGAVQFLIEQTWTLHWVGVPSLSLVIINTFSLGVVYFASTRILCRIINNLYVIFVQMKIINAVLDCSLITYFSIPEMHDAIQPRRE
jgi:hypothetical protein